MYLEHVILPYSLYLSDTQHEHHLHTILWLPLFTPDCSSMGGNVPPSLANLDLRHLGTLHNYMQQIKVNNIFYYHT